MAYNPEEEILGIINSNPGITYEELIYRTFPSPHTIWETLSKLKRTGKIKSVDIPGKKAKGWRII